MYEFREQCIEHERVFLSRFKSIKSVDDEELNNETNSSVQVNENNVLLDEIFVVDDQDEVEEDNQMDNNDGMYSSDGLGSSLNQKPESKSKQILTLEERKAIYEATKSPCDMCGKMVERKRMPSHINKHNGVQPYVCDVEGCDEKFYCRFRLTAHKRTNHGGFVFNCDICGKTFRNRGNLYGHKQYHRPPRFNCKICGQKYKSSAILKRHTKTHTGELPYKCPHCNNRAFSTSYNLKSHLRTHTKEKPFVCEECGVAYSYNSSLKAHIEKCHPNKVL